MALNLSTLTNASTSGTVLTEALTTADFLDSVPILANLANRGNKGGDAKQTVALNQPKALPLIDGKGYFYINGLTNNYASVPDAAALDVSGDLTLEVNVTIPDILPNHTQRLLSKYNTNTGNRSYQLALLDTSKLQFTISSDGSYQAENSKISTSSLSSRGIVDGQQITIKVTWRQSDGRVQFFFKTSNGSFAQLGIDQTANAGSIYNSNTNVNIGATNEGQITNIFKGAFHSAKIYASINETNKVLDVDFAATNIRNGDTKFKCLTGQVVTVNQSGNDPAKIIKRSVLRFDGVNDFIGGLLNQTINDGYMFAAFSVLGNGGDGSGRVFSINSTGIADSGSRSAIFSYTEGTRTNLQSYFANAARNIQSGMFDDSNGDILHEALIKNGSQKAGVNNANFLNTTISTTIDAEEFNISCNPTSVSSRNTAIDLEFLALFSAESVPDEATAKKIRDYINGRGSHPIFSLIDSAGYYFFDPQKAPVGAITTGSASWNGRIIGSDFGDSDRYATQGTTNEEPVGDGYVVTFADNADHLDIPQVTQAGWQVVGTSLGTFAYRVNNTAVTELNLLGNFGSAFNRKAGDLYGIILLPESATGADHEEARKLLIDRGAVDVPTFSSSVNRASWVGRSDIVEFKNTDFPQATSLDYAWENCDNMTQIGTVNAPLSTDFTASWKGTNSLRSFPAGAKLGTSAQNVNFTEAWRSSGLLSFTTNLPTGQTFTSCWRQCALKSFGAIDLSAGATFTLAWQQAVDLVSFGAIDARNATTFQEAWKSCSSLQQFPAGAKLGTSAANVNFTSAFRDSGLTSFPADIDLSAGGMFVDTWRGTNLTSFSTPITGVNSKRLRRAWHSCTALTDFSYNVFANWNPSIILTQVFDSTWDGCTALTAQSVGNILQGIDASNQFATVDGNSGSAAIVDAGIDIDFNTGTGSLSAATDSAITSLRGKGWVIFINGVERIP